MGGLLRCLGCGALRWSPLSMSRSLEGKRCEVCGGELRPERRRPGRRFKPKRERRDAKVPDGSQRTPPGRFV